MKNLEANTLLFNLFPCRVGKISKAKSHSYNKDSHHNSINIMRHSFFNSFKSFIILILQYIIAKTKIVFISNDKINKNEFISLKFTTTNPAIEAKIVAQIANNTFKYPISSFIQSVCTGINTKITQPVYIVNNIASKIKQITFYLIFFSLILSSSLAEIPMKEAAKSFGMEVLKKRQSLKLDETQVPGFQTANPKEAEYYKNPLKMEEVAKFNSEDDENFKITKEGAKNAKKEKEQAKEMQTSGNKIRNNAETIAKDINPYCIDGSCATKSEEEPSNKLADVVTATSIIKEIKKDVSKDYKNLSIFKGELFSCTSDKAGYNNCCKTDGWGEALGAKCSTREHTLSLKRKAKQCIQYRTYCDRYLNLGITKVCTVKKSEFCCFDNNLSRIVAENGRKQLNIPLGGEFTTKIERDCRRDFWGRLKCRDKQARASMPPCRGFTPDELSKIKMDKIDFSDFTKDLQINTKTISKEDLQSKIIENINSYDVQ